MLTETGSESTGFLVVVTSHRPVGSVHVSGSAVRGHYGPGTRGDTSVRGTVHGQGNCGVGGFGVFETVDRRWTIRDTVPVCGPCDQLSRIIFAMLSSRGAFVFVLVFHEASLYV